MLQEDPIQQLPDPFENVVVSGPEVHPVLSPGQLVLEARASWSSSVLGHAAISGSPALSNARSVTSSLFQSFA
jgi:hypothetical protein